ncbi:hypothetical protein [Methylomonas methanica]|nr:hypothetical protein [Methylomonas methanica]
MLRQVYACGSGKAFSNRTYRLSASGKNFDCLDIGAQNRSLAAALFDKKK